jgi:hypothetical protein
MLRIGNALQLREEITIKWRKARKFGRINETAASRCSSSKYEKCHATRDLAGMFSDGETMHVRSSLHEGAENSRKLEKAEGKIKNGVYGISDMEGSEPDWH